MPFLARIFCIGLIYTLLLPVLTEGRVLPAKYGVSIAADSASQYRTAVMMADSIVASSPMMSNKQIVYNIERPHIMIDKTLDFYLLTLLIVVFGLLRYADPRYLSNLWRAFIAPSQARAAKEQLDLAVVPNLLMNMFFVIVAGSYLYYVVGYTTPVRPRNISPGLLVVMLIAGIGIIYTAKYLAVKFSGWAFKINDITEYYIFNIFLVNKITAIALLPFVLLLAFGAPAWAIPAMIVSAAIIVLSFVNRYLRSWSVFGSFFQHSKFHFFTYLCASEILPLAVLVKLLIRGFLY